MASNFDSDLPGDTTSPGVIRGTGGSATGQITPAGDQDYYGTFLQAGHSYVIDLRGAPSGPAFSTLSDPQLILFNNANEIITSDDDSGFGFDSQITVRVTTDGIYYLRRR